MGSVDFVHLHTHSWFSLLQGVASIEELLSCCEEAGMGSCGLTDYLSSFGVFSFLQECAKRDIEPVIGNEIPLYSPQGKLATGVVVLLAENSQGYKNIMTLVSAALSNEQFEAVSYDMLADHSEGVICLSGGYAGPIAQAFLSEQDGSAELEFLLRTYGRKNFFLEISRNGLQGEERIISLMQRYAHEYILRLVATANVRYLFPAQSELYAHLIHLRSLSATHKTSFAPHSVGGGYQFLRAEEMQQLFHDLPEAVSNSVVIAKRCQFLFESDTLRLPQWEEGNPDQALAQLCSVALERMPLEMRDIAAVRLENELQVIFARKLSPYFLIVADLVRYARAQGIPVGPGRGSAVGSLVVYCSGITRVNPLKYNLLFERFLNMQRSDMPDIDLDIGWKEREQLFAYLSKRYGRDRVAHIATLDCYQARSAIRDAGRTLGFSTIFVDRIARLVPRFMRRGTLRDFLRKDKRLSEACMNSVETKQVVELAMQLEGRPRHVSVHAGAAVVSGEPLTTYSALHKIGANDWVAQLTGEDAAQLGLMKIDILGLRFLSVNADTAHSVPEFMSSMIKHDDPDVYAMLSKGQTTGIFQLESAGMRDILRRLQPENLRDLTAVLSLYRPGPMRGGLVDDFIARRHGKKAVTYPDPRVSEVLAETYGVFLYQEQVMLAANLIAGFGLDDADLLRRAMSKRDRHLLEPLRAKFIAGSGLDKKKGTDIFETLAHFAGYGFNKSHATAYAMTSYMNAFFKLYHPLQFFTALLNNNIGSATRLNSYLAEARINGINFLPLDINKSGPLYSIEGSTIRAALSPIKQVGQRGVRSIIDARVEGGEFHSLFDFCVRVCGSALDTQGVHNLIKSGAFDFLPLNRAQLLDILPLTMQEASRQREKVNSGQLSLFECDLGVEVVSTATPKKCLPEIDRLEMEYEACDFYYSSHPAAMYRDQAVEKGCVLVSSLGRNALCSCVGILFERRVVHTKKDKRMLFALLQDESGEIAITLFPAVYEQVARYCFSGDLLHIKGRVIVEGAQLQLIASEVRPFTDVINY